MVIRHTSTSLGTFVRGAVATLRASAKPGTLLKARAAIRSAIASTYPSLSTPAHALAHAPGAGAASSARTYITGAAPRTAHGANYGNTARTFARAGFRPTARTPHGAAVPATVGLGSARTFATAPAAGFAGGGATNVPVILRAFAHVFDDDDHKLPRGTQYRPYNVAAARRITRQQMKKQRQLRARRNRRASNASACSASSERSLLKDIGTYFPLAAVREVALPLLPEELVTPGTTSTLALPLAPSLSSILTPTPSVSYADAEIGVAILAGLTSGMMPLHNAYATSGARVIPLLARLESLGVYGSAALAEPPTTLEMSTDTHGDPDILRIVFTGRSAQDVRMLLGNALIPDADGCEWWALTQTHHAVLEPIDEIQEHWDSIPRKPEDVPMQESTVELVMPTLDMSGMVTSAAAAPEMDTDNSDDWPAWRPSPTLSPTIPASPVSPGTPISFASGFSTPHSFGPGSAGSGWTTSPSEYEYNSNSPNASLISAAVLAASLRRSDSSVVGWAASAPPSEMDEDVQSAWGSDSDGEHDAVVVSRVLELDHAPSWVGGGLGLAQPW